jgi:hypothetical protein
MMGRWYHVEERDPDEGRGCQSLIIAFLDLEKC